MTFVWRSLLYVPAHVEKFVTSPRIREADGVILDLEDSVPADRKAEARAMARSAVPGLVEAGGEVLVRINDEAELAGADIAAVVQPGLRALVAPKVRSVEHVHALERLIADAEAANGVAAGTVRLIVLIETAEGFLNMAAIAKASPRIAAINLGNEDFALDLGMEPDDDTLRMPRQQLVIAAAAAGVMPLGLMGVATRFDDLEAYRALALRSRRFGYAGATCIHPSQIAILNAAFSPTAEETAWAQRVVDGAEAATRQGQGAFQIDGKMIDAPIVQRARNLMLRSAIIRKSSERVT